VGIGTHCVYLIISLMLFYFAGFSETCDFLTYFNAGKIIIEDINDLYNQSNYLFPYRYFPISAYFFTPFSMMGLEIGYFVFQIFSLFLNFACCYIIYINAAKIQLNRLNSKKNNLNSRSIKYITIYLLCFPHFMNYALGQINNLITVFLLLALYFFLKNSLIYEFLGGILIGISISIKPLAIFIIPFIIIINWNRKNKKLKIDFKRSSLRLFGVIIPILVSVLFFILYPTLWQGFVDINFSGEYTEEGINNSISITRAILNLFYIMGIQSSKFIIPIIIVLIVAIPGFLIYIFKKNSNVGINEGLIMGMIIMLLVYFDSWDHHIVSLAPFLSIFLITINSRVNLKVTRLIKNFKIGYFLLALLVVPLSGLFFLTYQIFPFNLWASIFLLIIYISLLKFSFLETAETQASFDSNYS
ncbi:MAG: DUF2029 domain-containing protein, partial [Candidatus Lokiarchaeota archaeon]|nr:DUF2029 domain-containing protein [Candidatus Lokiarchaeota archaeon]